jgi:hypothetical protein
MKKRLFRRKNIILLLIIALEITACSYTSAEIWNMSEIRLADRAARVIRVTVANAAASHQIELNAGQVAAAEAIRWKGPVLSKSRGTITGPSGKETYYNLNMSIIVRMMKRRGFDYEYWVRDDGVKMFGDYVMVAANLDRHPRGSLVETSLGTGIVCDTGGFAKRNPTQIDIATTW